MNPKGSNDSVKAWNLVGIRAILTSSMTIVAMLGLTGCNDNKADHDAPAATGHETVSGPTGNLKNPKGAIAALSDFVCDADKSGDWSAVGKLTNNSSGKTRYLVSVSIIKSETSQVLGSAQETHTLRAKGQARIEMDNIYGKAGKGLACVPRVVSGN